MKSEFTLKLERCKGCGICVAFCPKQVLALDTLGKVYVAHHEKCIACGQCELRCPDYAIFMDKVVPKEVRRFDETTGLSVTVKEAEK